jgi:hypothetical protein
MVLSGLKGCGLTRQDSSPTSIAVLHRGVWIARAWYPVPNAVSSEPSGRRTVEVRWLPAAHAAASLCFACPVTRM